MLKINLTVKAFWDSKIQVFDGKWNIDENTFVLVRREEVVFFILELLFHFLVFSSTNLEVQVNLALPRVATKRNYPIMTALGYKLYDHNYLGTNPNFYLKLPEPWFRCDPYS